MSIKEYEQLKDLLAKAYEDTYNEIYKVARSEVFSRIRAKS